MFAANVGLGGVLKAPSYRSDAAVVDASALLTVPDRPQGIPVKKQEGKSTEMRNNSNLISRNNWRRLQRFMTDTSQAPPAAREPIPGRDEQQGTCV